MIVRYYIRCDYCQRITLLRLGVGLETDQSFEFPCEGCSEDISGVLQTDQVKGEVKSLSLDNATRVEAAEHDFIFTHHPDFPTLNSRGDEFSNPFLHAFSRHGESVLDRGRRTIGFQRFAAAFAQDVNRLVRHYKAEQWTLFKRDALEFLPDDWSFDHQIDRIMALYQVLELVLMPLVTSQAHVDLVRFLAAHVDDIAKNQRKPFVAFMKTVDNQSGLLKAIQNDALDLVPRLLANASDLQQATVDWDPETPNSPFPSNLEVHSRGGFHQLKSFYVDAYELVCRGLTLVVGLMNIHERGDADRFAKDPNDKQERPFAVSLLRFHSMSHGRKTRLLLGDLTINEWLSESLDSKLRNAIGHNTIEFDEATSRVTYPDDRSGRNLKTISYGEFLVIFVRAHQINQLVKILYIYRHVISDSRI